MEIPILIEKLQRALDKSIENSLSEHSIKYLQYRALETIKKNNRINPSHFTREFPIEGANLARQVESLNKMKLVNRSYDTNDRRLVWLEISQEGRDLTVAAGETINNCIEVFFSNIDYSDLEAFKSICLNMISNKN